MTKWNIILKKYCGLWLSWQLSFATFPLVLQKNEYLETQGQLICTKVSFAAWSFSKIPADGNHYIFSYYGVSQKARPNLSCLENTDEGIKNSAPERERERGVDSWFYCKCTYSLGEIIWIEAGEAMKHDCIDSNNRFLLQILNCSTLGWSAGSHMALFMSAAGN